MNAEEKGSAASSSLLPSVLVLLILLLVLAGAGYGLWKVLQTPEDPAAETTEVTAEAPTEDSNTKKGPIQKAKDAIAKVPVADVEDITGSSAPDLANEKTIEEAPPAETAEATPVVAETVPIGSAESSKQLVSQYLSGIHIGGVRKGERPMILIQGESFHVGDVVHSETGLKFDGLRDGRLAFRDSHGIVYLKSF